MDCVLFNQKVAFSDSELRYYDLLRTKWGLYEDLGDKFYTWYEQECFIGDVIKNYLNFVDKLLVENVLIPLSNTLPDLNIFDITQDEFIRKHLLTSNSENGLYEIDDLYRDILRKLGEEKNYRSARKASRSRWQGGGFGIEGAIKGAVQAGALNAVSGVGHGVANTIGNMGSSIAAGMEKSSLYNNKNTKTKLVNGIWRDIDSIFSKYISFVNGYHSRYIYSSFDTNKANAFFENSKNNPQKAGQLLAQSVQFCPWNEDVLSYIFINFSNERKTTWSIAQKFDVDLTNYLSQMIENEYPINNNYNNEQRIQVKKRILALMQEYNIKEDDTLNRLEQDCLSQLCLGYEKFDTETCDEFLQKVYGYDALDKNKVFVIENLNNRKIEIIKENDEIVCKEIYLNTSLDSYEQVSKAIREIEKLEKNYSAEKYINTLEKCTEKKLKLARKYRHSKIHIFYTVLSIIMGITSAIAIFAGLYLILILLLITLTILFGVIANTYKSAWNLFTFNDTYIHPSLEIEETLAIETSAESEESV